MRDKARIEPFLKNLQKFWEANQDLRFGQIIYILAEQLNNIDLFFPEESEWNEAINKSNTRYIKGIED